MTNFTIHHSSESADFIKGEIKKLEAALFAAHEIMENLDATDINLLKLASEIEKVYSKVTDITFQEV